MKKGLITVLGAGVLLLGTASAAPQEPAAGELASGKIMREIDDPHTGDRWLLVRNDQAPGGPGRLVLVAAHRSNSGGAVMQPARQLHEARIPPVIRAGDRLLIEEHTAQVDAVLEARALNPAAPGSVLNVRMMIGGNVVRAIALGPGRAALQGERP